MSDTEIVQIEAEQGLRRSVELGELQLRDDGRTVHGKIVPFREAAKVTQRRADGQIESFEEMFAPGSLTACCQLAQRRGNAGWIALNLDHDESFDNRVGYATELEQREDGGYATFRLYEGPQLPKVRSMLEESHKGLSVMFDDVAKPRLVGGIRERVQVYLHHVAATPSPVYSGAGVLAMRSDEGGTLSVSTPALDEIDDYLARERDRWAHLTA
jgi:phage head maturation protease